MKQVRDRLTQNEVVWPDAAAAAADDDDDVAFCLFLRAGIPARKKLPVLEI